jgi:hypothetical protein
MTGILQAFHIAKKDVRQHRWPLLVFALLVALAAWSVAADREWIVANGLVVLLAGVLLQTLIIQGDSPVRSDAMWIGLPLDARAVFAAKVLSVIVMVILVAVLGQWIALASLDVPVTGLAGLLASASWNFGEILIITALIAALTRDLKSFLVATIIWFIASQFYVNFVNRVIGSERNGMLEWWAVDAMVSGAVLLVIARAYRHRRLASSATFAVLLLLVTPFAPVLTRSATRSVLPSVAILADSLRPRIETHPWQIPEVAGSGGRTTIGFPVDLVGASPGIWYALVEPRLHVELPDGSAREEDVDSRFVWLSREPLQLRGGERWLVTPPSDARGSFPQVLLIPGLARVNHLGARATLTGTVVAYRPSEVADLPLREGASFVDNGRRLTVVSMTSTDRGPQVSVRLTTARLGSDLSRAMGSTRWQAFGYVLVDSATREGMPLTERGYSTAGGSGLVLPGSEGQRMRISLSYWEGRPDSLNLSTRNWSSLRLIDWKPIGSFPITVTTTVTKP